jgi:hypothetical protein
VTANFDYIQGIQAYRAYLEVGFPAWAQAPHLRADYA